MTSTTSGNLLLPEGIQSEYSVSGTVDCLVTILAATNFPWDLVVGFCPLQHASAKE